jgi:2'-5' RNA ligase
MVFCIAGLIDDDSQNQLRKVVYLINQKYDVGIIASLLPQHVSLKISFQTSYSDLIDKYFDEFASRFSPFEITGTNFELVKIQEKDKESGLIWYGVEENTVLRKMHTTLNDDLLQRFQIKNAEYDGDRFHFHSTLVYGNKAFSDYAEIFESAKKMLPKMNSRIEKVGLFCCHENEIVPGKFYAYKIRDLGSIDSDRPDVQKRVSSSV